MFKNIKEVHKLKIALGNYVSHNVVTFYDRENYTRKVRSVEELNSLDRIELAKQFYNDTFLQWGRTVENEDEFIKDVAIYFDGRIPKSYYKWSNKRHDSAPANFIVNAEELGLIYQFKEDDYGFTITERQKKYIIDLIEDSGYIIKDIDTMTISEASLIIDFLLGNIDETPDFLFTYLQYE